MEVWSQLTKADHVWSQFLSLDKSVISFDHSWSAALLVWPALTKVQSKLTKADQLWSQFDQLWRKCARNWWKLIRCDHSWISLDGSGINVWSQLAKADQLWSQLPSALTQVSGSLIKVGKSWRKLISCVRARWCYTTDKAALEAGKVATRYNTDQSWCYFHSNYHHNCVAAPCKLSSQLWPKLHRNSHRSSTLITGNSYHHTPSNSHQSSISFHPISSQFDEIFINSHRRHQSWSQFHHTCINFHQLSCNCHHNFHETSIKAGKRWPVLINLDGNSYQLW